MDWNERVVSEAREIIDRLRSREAVGRVIGSVAPYLHCDRCGDLAGEAGLVARDIDLVTRERWNSQLKAVLEERGYRNHRQIEVGTEGRRLKFSLSEVEIDVVVGDLQFSHRIPVLDRLEEHSYTLGVTDLVLEKLQATRPSPKDLTIAGVYLQNHCKCLDRDRICDLVGADWGLYYDMRSNLTRLIQMVEAEQVELGVDSARRATKLRAALEDCEKSIWWRLRGLIGTRLPWSVHVEETEPQFTVENIRRHNREGGQDA